VYTTLSVLILKRLAKLSHASAVLHSLLQAFETLGTIGSNLLRSQRLIEVLAGAGEKMSKAEINECLATINRSGFTLSTHIRPSFQHSFCREMQSVDMLPPELSGAFFSEKLLLLEEQRSDA
jgi:hypothetical protein